MKYDIEYQAIGEGVWHCLGERYSTQGEALIAIPTVIARGGKWARRVYRVGEKHATEPTHLELIRLVERLETEDADFAFWAEDGAEAVLLLGDDRVVVAVPGAPVWDGHSGGRPIGAIVSKIQERVRAERERAERERADRAQWETGQQERAERERAERERADQERAERERADRAQWENALQERAASECAERERANQERANQERADRAQWEKEQQERAERERVERGQWEQAQQERAAQAGRDHAERERLALDHAADDRAERQRAPR